MKKIKVDFKNCYGINSINHQFDFSRKRTIAVYSPNGVMKTSFAKTFKDIIDGRETHDQIFPEKTTVRSLADENGNEIPPENIFVIEPYSETYRSEKVSILLVNAGLKNRYEAVIISIDKKKDLLLSAVKKLTGIRGDIEDVISETFTRRKGNFFQAITRVKEEVLDESPALFGEVDYKLIFAEKSIEFISDQTIKNAISEYISKYDELLGKSNFFKKGIFNHTNAATIAKNLKDNGFFKANHKVHLSHTAGFVEVKNEKELEKIIDDEKQGILGDPELVNKFEQIDKKLSANKELRDYRDYLLANPHLIAELADLSVFKDKVWISFLKSCKDIFAELIGEYEQGKIEIDRILAQAKNEITQWSFVIDEFNKRFSVPFVLSIGNQEQVILKSEAPVIQFEFVDQNGRKSVGETDLRNVLSTGEKRALYLLNIIFEVEARKESQIPTLFVVDDIADSFDYKNKYAIIEYLKDISSCENFWQIILTHNYDFFRTISSRLDMERGNKLNTDRDQTEIKIFEEQYQNNPFSFWKKHLETNRNMLVASVPFVRNLAEFTGDNSVFDKLTSLLHYKQDTDSITVGELEGLLKRVLVDKQQLAIPDHAKSAKDLIFECADSILSEANEMIDLEKKICLAIAIRLKAEIYMVAKINDQAFWGSITSNQGYKLYAKICTLNISTDILKLLDQVNLMTPENIHINSFMYEPILDMSIHHLKSLYAQICALT